MIPELEADYEQDGPCVDVDARERPDPLTERSRPDPVPERTRPDLDSIGKKGCDE